MTNPKDQMSGLVNELQSTSQLYPAMYIYIYIVGGYPEQVRSMVSPIYGYGNHQKEVFGPIGKVVEKNKHVIKYKRYFFLVCMIVSRNSVDFPAR